MASANTPVTVTMEVRDDGRWGFTYDGKFQEFTKVETPLARKSTQDATIGIVIGVIGVLLVGWCAKAVGLKRKNRSAVSGMSGNGMSGNGTGGNGTGGNGGLRPIDTAKGLRFTKVETQIV